eukprot:5415847-Amphidinium_carterae.2
MQELSGFALCQSRASMPGAALYPPSHSKLCECQPTHGVVGRFKGTALLLWTSVDQARWPGFSVTWGPQIGGRKAM